MIAMDKNTELSLAHSAPAANWEDEEKATNDLDELGEDFRKRLYAERGARLINQSKSGAATSGSRPGVLPGHGAGLLVAFLLGLGFGPAPVQPGVGRVRKLFQERQVVAAEAGRVLPLVAVLVQPRER